MDVHGCSLGDPTWMALVATFASCCSLILLHVSADDFVAGALTNLLQLWPYTLYLDI